MLAQVFATIGAQSLKMLGWQLEGSLPNQSCVVVVAPHTSNWDFFILFLVALALKAFSNAVWIAKHTIFWWPIGSFFRSIGGVPVHRDQNNNMIRFVCNLLKERELMYFALAPEGTRKFTDHWKKGFYHIANRANVPISLAFVNYKDKKAGIGPLISITGDEEQDLAKIQSFYKKNWAKFPENFSNIRF